MLGYVPDLTTLLAAGDVAVVQGGLTTCMELTALRKPFVYVPLRHHFEQNFHVRRRLERYGAGTCLDYDGRATRTRSPAAIVAEATRDRRRTGRWRPTVRRGPRGCSPTCSDAVS